MILYSCITEDGEAFFSRKAAALAQAKSFGPSAGVYVVRYDIGHVNKAKICQLASGRGFAESQKVIYRTTGDDNDNRI